LVQEVQVTGKEHHSSVHVAETEPPASSMENTTLHVAETESQGSGTAKAAHVTETEPRGMVKPAHVAETEEEIHITLSIPNRGRLEDNTSQNNTVNPPVTTNADQQQTRSDLTSILKEEEEEEEDASRTLRLKTGQDERPEEEDEDTDSEDTLGLLQKSKDLLTRHSMADIRMNPYDEIICPSMLIIIICLSLPIGNNQLSVPAIVCS
jgi:hypothetical protein